MYSFVRNLSSFVFVLITMLTIADFIVDCFVVSFFLFKLLEPRPPEELADSVCFVYVCIMLLCVIIVCLLFVCNV